MALSDDDIGLYNDTPPDATVDGYVEDPANPGWVEATFSDGRTATLPKDHVEAMPQTPSAMPYGAPASPMGPPLPPPDPAAAPADPAAPGYAPPPGFAPVAPVDPSAQPGVVPAGPLVQRGDSFRPEGQLPGTGLQTPGGVSGLPGAQYDPMSDVVSEGGPGGMAPFSQSTTEGTTQSSTVDDPAAMQARLDQAAADEAGAERMRDTVAYRGRADAIDEELDQRDAQEALLQQQQRKAELEISEHQRVVDAIEKEPIDEDGFWSEKPGREAAAWVALALSGFLQGATKGQNPALAQMMNSLEGAQTRWLDNQQKNRDSVVRRREKLMGSAENARDSVKMQLSGIMNKKIDLEAQRAGLPVPPGLETYKAKKGLEVATAQNAIGSRIDQQSTRQAQAEQRATAATGPVRRGDQVLQRLGVAPKAHADAMDPKGLNLGGVVGGAERLQTIGQALEEVAARHGGSLPSQETVSWSSLGLAPQAARLGIGGGKDEVSVKQLMEEAKLAFKQTVNIKSIDSENEGKSFNAIIDSGEGASTIAAVRARADIANQNAVSIASGVTRDPQGYVEFVRGTMANNQGVKAGQGPQVKRSTGYQAPGGAPQEQSAVEATTGGGPAPRPLAEQGPARPRQSQGASAGRDPDAIRTIKEHASEAGYDPEAMHRIINFESGGRPGIKNSQSGATGLIQFMPKTFASMKKPPGYEDVTFEDLPSLTVDEQMPLVVSYLQERGVPPDADVGEMYLAVAAPAALGRPDEYVVYPQGSKAWEQNSAWRPAGGGDITAGDIRARARRF